MTKAFFLITILFFLILFGCTEMTREEKNLCYSLTTQSYSYITNCKTEQTCFKEIDKLFSTNLGYEQESKLYELKNNFGRSWFYYNKSVDELKKISDFCSQGNALELPGSINQTRFFLEQAFREMDLGMKNSFESIFLQEQILTQQKIDFLKEEDIYYDLIELRQIISDLETSNTKNNNYVSYYLNKIQLYNNSTATKKFNYLIEQDSFWIKSYKFVEESILEKLGIDRKSNFPFLSNYFYDTITSLEILFFKTASISELKKFPAKEFMKLYSDLAGYDNSSIKRFANLTNKVSKNFEKIKKEIPVYWKKVNELEKETENLFQEIIKNKKFDYLEKELLKEGIEKQINYYTLFETCKKEILLLKENKSKNILGMGEELYNLKKLNNLLTEINSNFKVKKEKEIILLKQKCVEEAEKIKKENYNIEKKELILIKQDLLFFANNVTKKNSELFYYCEEMLKKKNFLLEGMKNFEKLESKKIDLTKNCFSYLDKIIYLSKEQELIFLFEKLKNTTVTSENLFYFNNACESIKTQLINILKDDFFVKNIVENIKKILNEKEKMIKLNYYLQDKKIDTQINALEKKCDELEKYYNNEEIFFQNILPKKEILLENLTKYYKDISLKNEEYQLLLIEKLIKKEYLAKEIGFIENDMNLKLKITINNPFETINKKHSFNIEIEEGNIIEKPTNLENIFFGKNGFIILKNIPTGKTEIVLNVTKKIDLIEKDKIIYATTNSGLIQRNIIVNSEKINKLLIKTKKPLNSTKIIVLIDNEEKNYSIIEEEIYFIVEDVDKKTKINILIYTEKLIDLKQILKKDQKINIHNKKIEYEIITKNLTNNILNGTIIIPLHTTEKINKINIFDEEMINKKKEILNNNLVLKNHPFLEKQEKKFLLILEIDSLEEYYLEQLKMILNNLKNYDEKIISEKIEKILLINFNENLINDYEKIIKKSNEKLLELEKEKNEFINNQIKIEKINQKIILLRKDLEEIEELNLNYLKKDLEKILNESIKEKELENFDKALLLLTNNSFKIDEELLKKVKEINNYIKTRENEQNFIKLNEQILEKTSEFEKKIFFEPIFAKKIYLEIIDLFEEYQSQEKKILKQKDLFEKQKISEFNENITEIKKLIIILEKQFDTNYQDAIKNIFVYPITKNRLEKLKSDLQNIEISGFDEKKIINLNNISKELKLAVDEIKKFVIKEYNNAIDLGKDYSILANAKKEIDANNYMQALLILKNAKSNDFLLLGFLPIILIFFVIGVLKLNFLKKKKSDANLKQKVLEEWEN